MTDLTREQIEVIRAVAAVFTGVRRDDLLALCRMALAYLDATEWRPIETAPKQCYPNIIVADIRTGDVWTDWWDYDCECWANAGESNIAPPTHWMPAPNPPAAIRAQQEGK